MDDTPLISKTTTRFLAGLLFFGSVLILFAWQYDLHSLKNFADSWISIKPIACIGFIMISFGLWLLPVPPSRTRNALILFAALLGLAIASTVLVLRLTHSTFNVNKLIFPNTPITEQPSLLSAINFILVAIAFIFTSLNHRCSAYAQYLFAFSLIIPLLALMGYLYNTPFFYEPGQSGAISIITALLFLFSGFTALLGNSQPGIVRIFKGHQPGNIFAKYLIPPAILIPIIFGYFHIEIMHNKILDENLNDSIMLMLMILLPVPIIWTFAFWVNKKDTELRLAKDRAEFAHKVKSVFLAIMSHEIRTPLNGVLGMTTLLQDTPQTPEQKNYTDNIRLSGETLLRVINDILDYSKIEAGRIDLEYIDFDVHKLLEDSIKLIELHAIQKGLTLYLKIDPSVPAWIHGDPTRINQILINFLSNAVKFTQKGDITIAVSVENNQLRFEVSDTGIGISPESKAHLFKPFSQGELSTTRKYGGTGLGLAIAKRLVDGMGGEIGVESTLGVGSTFWFTIPLKLAASPKPIIEKSIAPTPTDEFSKNIHILVAEDNAINAQVIIHMLKNLGFTTVNCVGNGLEALHAVDHVLYDLVFMDCEMPEMNGYDATRIIRETQKQHIPIVAMTAHALQGDKEKCLDSGMDDYIPKPIDRNELLRVLQKWLTKH